MAIQQLQHTSIHGIALGLQKVSGALVSYGKRVGSLAGDAVITIGAEVSNVRPITIQLNDWKGKALKEAEEVEIVLFNAAVPTDFGTNGSTGLAIGASGKLLTVVTGKVFKALSTTTGLIALTWTDTGTQSFAIGVRLPSGRLVMSTAQANT